MAEIDVIRECAEAQLAELETLSSVFCRQNELQCYDEDIRRRMKSFVDGETDEIPGVLDFVIAITVGEGPKAAFWQLSVTLPPLYPLKSAADVFVRCPNLGRDAQHKLNRELQSYLDGVRGEDAYVYSATVWIQDHCTEYLESESSHRAPSKPEASPPPKAGDARTQCRFWIYSHHIYNQTKRKEILGAAEELSLSGFSLPGKPGIICVEGFRNDCSEFWSRIRSLNWQKIVLKNEEKISSRRFDGFKELCFDGGKKLARSYHMDMGEFSKFLDAHGCGYAFKDYFGFDPAPKTETK